MSGYIPLGQAFAPTDPTQFANELSQNQANEQQVQKNKIALKEVSRLAEQQQLIRDLVKKHTVVDPSTGQMATDHKAVIQDAYLTNPEAAETYQTHVEDMTAERATKLQTAEKAKQETAAARQKAVGEMLSGVDEMGDQDQAKADYSAGIASLKAAGVPIDPADEVYSPGRVAFWKRKLIGPVKQFEADAKESLADDKYEAAAKLAERKGELAADLAAQRGADAKEVARIRSQAQVTAASIRANATRYSADVKGGSDDEDDDSDMVDLLADQYHLEGKLPALGQGQAGLRKRILRRVASKYGKDAAGDIVSNAAGTKANTSSLQKNQTNADAVAQAEQTAIANGELFLQASSRLAGKRGRYAPINAAKNAIGRATGDPDVVAMDAALKVFTSEFARVVSSSPSGAGQLTDSARNEAMATLSGNYSIGQKKKALLTLKQDMANRVKATNAQLSTIRNRTRTGGSSVNASDGSAPPPGALRKIKMGGVEYYQMKDGSTKKVSP